MTKPEKKKRQKPRPFDFFAVPLKDGSFGMGQLIGTGAYDEDVYVLYQTRVDSIEKLREGLDATVGEDAIGIVTVGTRELRLGEWTIIGNEGPDRRPYITRLPLPPRGSSFTGEIVPQFLEAWSGLRRWDDFPMAPRWFRSILLPHLEPPAQDLARPLVSTQPPDAPSASAAPPSPKPSPVLGPGEVHVQIRYEGDGFPGVHLLRKRQALEAWIEREKLGEVVDAGGGGGIMDIYVEARDAPKAATAIGSKLEEIGWKGYATVELAPLDEPTDSVN